jgi:hypothetical protein
MADIATVPDLASFLQITDVNVPAAALLLGMAQGLVVEEIGVQDPWPSVAKSVALSATARAYVNPEGWRQEPGVGSVSGGIYNNAPLYSNGVYLSESEKAQLHAWANGPGGSTALRPQGCFPAARAWPDPAEVP